jgi:hypothetical protein
MRFPQKLLQIYFGHGKREWFPFTAGLFPAAFRALGVASKMLRVRVLGCFVFCHSSLSKDLHPAAIALLVENDVMELTIQEMVEGAADMGRVGASMLLHCITDPRARERMCAPEVIDTLMQWIGEWIPTVRRVVVPRTVTKINGCVSVCSC